MTLNKIPVPIRIQIGDGYLETEDMIDVTTSSEIMSNKIVMSIHDMQYGPLIKVLIDGGICAFLRKLADKIEETQNE